MAEILSTLSSDGLAGTPTGGGARYTSIVTWESSQQKTIGAGDTEVLECYPGTTVQGNWQADSSLNEQLDFADWVTTPSQNVTVRPVAGSEANGVTLVRGGSGFALIRADRVLQTFDSDITFQDFEVEGDSGANPVLLRGGITTLNRMMFFAVSGIGCRSLGATINAESSLFRGAATLAFASSDGPDAGIVNNCAFVADGTSRACGFASGAVATNCWAITAGVEAWDANDLPSAASDFNASNDTSAPGATTTVHNVSLADGVDLVSPSTNDYNIVVAGALDSAGTNSVLPLDDIANIPHRNPPEIGPYAIAGALGVTATGDVTAQLAVTTGQVGAFAFIPQVTITLVNKADVPQANLTNLKWSFFDQVSPDLLLAPVIKANTGTTDGSGVFSEALAGSTLSTGGIGYLVVSDTDGDEDQIPAQAAFIGPVEVL